MGPSVLHNILESCTLRYLVLHKTLLFSALFVIPHCIKTLLFTALFFYSALHQNTLFSSLFAIPHCTKPLLFSALFVIPHCTENTYVRCTLRKWYSALHCTKLPSSCSFQNWYSAMPIVFFLHSPEQKLYLLSFIYERKSFYITMSSTYLICSLLTRWREPCGYEVTYTSVGSWYT